MLARDAIIARLTDSRWYVLRNLILMLRLLDDISVLEHVRPLLNNSHLRVRQEALRCCLQFNDPAAERQILYGLDSPDRETQLASILLAEKSRSVDVFKKLLAIIAKSGFSSIEYELKSAAVNSLAEIGRADALPELAKVLASMSLLNSRSLTRLKIDIVRSLSNYPPAVALPILTKLAVGSGEVSRQANVSLKMMTETAS
jgi:HEAT repeat protein